MAKISLNPAPTFKATVAIPLAGGGTHEAVFTFKHRTRKELAEYFADNAARIEAGNAKTDAEHVFEHAIAWDLDDEFCMANIERLCNTYHAAGEAIVVAYVRELTQARRGN